jgi:hypothetical protein
MRLREILSSDYLLYRATAETLRHGNANGDGVSTEKQVRKQIK